MARVLLDARTVQRRRGGIGRMVEGLATALARIRPELELFLITGRHGANDLARAGPLVREVPVEAGTVDPAFEAGPLRDLVRDLRPDVYHATCFVLPDPPLPCRTVVTLHDACVRRRPELVRPGLAAILDRATEVSLRVAGVAVAVSEFSRRELALAYGVPAERLHVVPNGVDASFFEAPSPDASGRLDLPAAFWLLPGATEERKGLPEAIAGHARHARRDPARTRPLLVAGARGGGARLDPETLAAAEGLPPGAVRRLGWVGEAELRALYHRADGVLLPSRYEGFGLGALEALAAGAPTVVASGSALEEVTGDAALVVPPEDPDAIAAALDRLRDDPDLVRRLRAAGPARARTFSWETAAAEYLRIYGLDRPPAP